MVVQPSPSPASSPVSLVPSRVCGTCVACCKVMDIPELQTPAGVLCPHSTGSGCGIYENRPPVCRRWYCLWRQLDVIPEEARPDRIGVVFSAGQDDPPASLFEQTYFIGRAVNGPSDYDHPLVQEVINLLATRSPYPVWLGRSGFKKLVHPGPELRDAILHPSRTVHQRLLPQAMAWRQRLGLDRPAFVTATKVASVRLEV